MTAVYNQLLPCRVWSRFWSYLTLFKQSWLWALSCRRVQLCKKQMCAAIFCVHTVFNSSPRPHRPGFICQQTLFCMSYHVTLYLQDLGTLCSDCNWAEIIKKWFRLLSWVGMTFWGSSQQAGNSSCDDVASPSLHHHHYHHHHDWRVLSLQGSGLLSPAS